MLPDPDVRDLNAFDYVTLFFIMIPLLALPFLIGYRQRHLGLLDLTFAGRGLGYMTMAFSMTLSESGLSELTGWSGWAVQSGVGIYAIELVSAFGILVLGWIFMPVYMASGSLTTIDYAKKRFGGKRIEITLVILMLIINVVTKISVELYSANIMISRLHPVPSGSIYAGVLLGSVLLISTGGLYSLVYTNLWSMFFGLISMPIIFLFSYRTFNNWQEITVNYRKSWPHTTIEHVTNSSDYKFTKCGIPDVYSLDVVRPHNDPVLPWPGMIFGHFIISLYTYCIDQSILQFCICGKNIVNVKYACIVSGFLQICTILMIIPGFIARILFTDIVACADPDVCERTCGKRSGCSDLAMPLLFKNVIPFGWRGIVLAVCLSLSLTSVAAALHAGSTIFTFNLYRIFRPSAREYELTLAGKLAILVQGGLGLTLAVLFDKFSQVHEYITDIYASLVPPLVAVYITSIFWEHVTERIAFHALLMGTCLASIRLVWKSYHGPIPCGEESKFHAAEIVVHFHDLHFAIFLFVVCCSFIIINGMTTEAIHEVYLYRLIFWLRHSHLDRLDINYLKSHDKSLDNESFDSQDRWDAHDLHFNVDHHSEHYVSYGDDYEDYYVDYDHHQVSDQTNALEKDGSCLKVFGGWSKRKITDELLGEAMKEMMSVRELPRQTLTLNLALIFVLLLITYFMAFFS